MQQRINKLLQRIQPLMDTVDLEDITADLNYNINQMVQKTGVSTPDYVKRLLILSNQGLITNDEYVGLIFHFSEHPPLETGSEFHLEVDVSQTATSHSYL